MKPKTLNGRVLATRLLHEVLQRQRSLNEAQNQLPTSDPRESAFAVHLAYGALRHWGALDWLLQQMLAKPLRQRDQDIHYLAALGLLQLWQDDTPGHAAVHATAQCARDLNKPWAVGLVNAVLRRFQREQAHWLAQLEASDSGYSHPEWLLNQLRTDWPDHWQRLVTANNEQAPLWLRCNRQQQSPEQLQEKLKEAGFTIGLEPSAPEAISIEPAVSVEQIPGFSQGSCSVQDPAAQLAASLMALEPGMRVLDACAAPGGKTGHLLEQQPGLSLLALDRSEQRLEQVRENLGRLGLSAELVCADAAEVDQWWDGVAFDRILLDAPCSATGVIRRHPEIKWLRSPEQVRAAAQVQKRLLNRLWPLLKPEGMLVYATCSVLKLENSQQIQDFIEAHADAQSMVPDAVPGLEQPFGRQILPGDRKMDGFYYALLRKRVDGTGSA